jgi:hypothetical protein
MIWPGEEASPKGARRDVRSRGSWRHSILAAAVLSAFLIFPAVALGAPPVNDDFAAALQLGGDPVGAAGITWSATKEPNEPSHAGDPGGSSVWYEWTAPRSERVYLQMCTGGWNGLLAVYRGGSLAGLTLVASTDSLPGEPCRELRFRMTAGVAYRIAVDGYSAGGTSEPERGGFELWLRSMSMEPVPANDSFAAATVVGSNTQALIVGTTERASREAGEPGFGSPGASVWFRWTAPTTTAMRIDPCMGDFHPSIAVYTGSTLDSLASTGSPVAGDAGAQQCQLGELRGLGFEAVAGVSYSFAVDSASGDWGGFQLLLQATPLPFIDTQAPNTYVFKGLHTRRGKVSFRFTAYDPGATYLCKRDKQRFSPCTSPKVYPRLAPGWHRFAVKATDAVGNVDSTPAVRRFRVAAR